MADGGEFYMHMMNETVDIDAISLSMSIEEVVAPNNNIKKCPKHAANYSTQEDNQLVMSWQDIGQDPIIGNEQPCKAYWVRIHEHYHVNRNFESDRNANSLEHRFGIIHKETNKWQRCYDEIERRHPSGVPYQQHVVEAQALYKQSTKKFYSMFHCWLLLRNNQKWMDQRPIKRPRSSKSASPLQANADEDDEGSKDPTADSQPAKKRPPGRKGEKEKAKKVGEGGVYKEQLQKMLVTKIEAEAKKEERWKEMRDMQARKMALEEKKVMWDQESKIMFCDVDSMVGDQKAYVLAMRAQIIASKMAAFSSTFDGSFGGDGGGGGGGDGSFTEEGSDGRNMSDI